MQKKYGEMTIIIQDLLYFHQMFGMSILRKLNDHVYICTYIPLLGGRQVYRVQ